MYAKRLAAMFAAAFWFVGLDAGAHSEGDDAMPDAFDCDHLPGAALVRLPEPIADWARIDCLPSGQLIAPGKEWSWRYPASFTTPVSLPAWFPDPMQAAAGGRYFVAAKVDVARAAEANALHERFAREVEVYAAMAEGRPPPGEVYSLTATNDLGQDLRVHFLYRSRRDVWAIVCAPDCRSENSFLVSARGN